MNKIIRVKSAKSWWEKSVGLLGTKEPLREGGKPVGLHIQTRFGVHTLGMKYPIDVLILDDKHTVVRIKENLQPGNIYIWNPKYSQVIELPGGTVEKEGIEVGDRVQGITT